MTKINGHTGQLKGPFAANEDLVAKIKSQIISETYESDKIIKIGIFSKFGHTININGVPFYLGKEGMFEFRDTPIISLFFEQEEDLNSFIDYLYED